MWNNKNCKHLKHAAVDELTKAAVFRTRIHFIRIRIQNFRLHTDPDPDPIRVQGFDDQKLEKIYL